MRMRERFVLVFGRHNLADKDLQNAHILMYPEGSLCGYSLLCPRVPQHGHGQRADRNDGRLWLLWPWVPLRAFASEVSLGLFLVMRIRRQVPGPEYVQNSVLVAPCCRLARTFHFLILALRRASLESFSVIMIYRVLPFNFFLHFRLCFLIYLSFFSYGFVWDMRYTCGIHVCHGLPGIKGVSHGWGVARWCRLRAESWELLPRWRTRSSKVMTWVLLWLLGMFLMLNCWWSACKKKIYFEVHAARQYLVSNIKGK